MGYKLVFLLPIIFMISGCGPGNDEASGESRPAIIETQLDALDKAKNVENMMLDAASERNKSLD
jgi:hypothetical protein